MLLFLSACGKKTTTLPGNGDPAGQVETTQAPPSGEKATEQEESKPELEPPPAITMSPAQTSSPIASPTSSKAGSPTTTPIEKPPSSSLPSPASLTAPLAKTPVAKTPAAKTPLVQPSRSLAGHDRFLVSRPFGSVRPADFELGLLFDSKAEPVLGVLLNDLAKAISEKKLPATIFSSQGFLLAELLYSAVLASAPEVTRIRFSEARQLPGAPYTVGIRLFSEKGFAAGLAIIDTDEESKWLIEHLDLDLKELGEQKTRSQPWDPYGFSRNLFD
jgi:hypothetical protein